MDVGHDSTFAVAAVAGEDASEVVDRRKRDEVAADGGAKGL
uniref:Uncharacterized protein n=1 Tax=Arundo donax TaxID=35708 RepID=A0A0A8YRU1_ARUDO